MKISGLKRKLIQLAAFGFTNSRLGNFAKGSIYKGKWKSFCTPGMNCYSCPAATFACPIGAIQAVGSSIKMGFSFYAIGLVLAFGVLLGRAICGFLCPFGLFQELLHLIKTPKLKLAKIFTYIKYVILVVMVLLLPAVFLNDVGIGKPWFCEYICPVGTLEAGIPLLAANSSLSSIIGTLFYVKLGILIAVIILSVLIYRFFCKAMCPLGALYGLLNKISLLHLECDKSKCTQCGLCSKACKMDVDPVKDTRSAECILCGKCTGVCGSGALKITCIPEAARKTTDNKNDTDLKKGE